jgi:hypothetical protein
MLGKPNQCVGLIVNATVCEDRLAEEHFALLERSTGARWSRLAGERFELLERRSDDARWSCPWR